jgi:SAM-dependent methyltransferase
LKAAALESLCCPACAGPLTLQVQEQVRGDIRHGSLRCSCGKSYAIEGGVAEFVPDGYTASFSFQWYASKGTPSKESLAATEKERFLERIGIDPARLRGKRVLDAGCGRGTLARVLAGSAQEVIGLDLSDGVKVAADFNQGNPSVSILRGDILNPPLKRERFDYIISMGVLHHTADCKAAFLSLVRCLRPGGVIAIWVYSAYSTYRNKASDFLRRFTTRMPRRLLYLLCHLAVPLNYLQQIPILGVPFRVIPVAGDGPWSWVVLGTYDWYSPRYQSKHTFPEIVSWFEEAGLERIRVHDWNICVSGQRPQG